MQTKGEYRVGISFNPSAAGIVDQIKRASADLIDLIESIPQPGGEAFAIGDYPIVAKHDAEVARLKSLAQTAIEEGAMWAVKAATKPVQK